MKILLTLIFFVVACVSSPATINRQNLLNLQPEMTKDEVLQIMGRPGMNEAFTTESSGVIEVYFYRTEGGYPRTPLVFINNELVGWGLSFYRDTTKKYDIDIEIKGETP